jgi:hypothetical protein
MEDAKAGSALALNVNSGAAEPEDAVGLGSATASAGFHSTLAVMADAGRTGFGLEQFAPVAAVAVLDGPEWRFRAARSAA